MDLHTATVICIFLIELAQPRRVTVNITRADTGGLQSANVRWLNEDGERIRNDSSNLNPYNVSVDLQAGHYFIEITPSSDSQSGTYNLTVR